MSRTISFTEVSSALTCQAKHAFAYTGRLTDGERLKPRGLPAITSGGRAWGRAMAAYHAEDGLMARWAASEALIESLREDADEMREAGLPVDPAHQQELYDRLVLIANDYANHVVPIGNLTRIEEAVDVPLRARFDGGRSSSRYRYLAYVDGFTADDDGWWLVEFKLRNKLEPEWRVEMNRQLRWYAWAVWRRYGGTLLGVIYDQRLNEVPQPPRVNKDGRVSHDVRQNTTERLYLEACVEHATTPNWETVERLKQREWQKRSVIMLTPREIEEAGRELASAGNLIGQLYRGELEPVRNAGTHCSWCDFRQICLNPSDQPLVDSLFTRKEPK